MKLNRKSFIRNISAFVSVAVMFPSQFIFECKKVSIEEIIKRIGNISRKMGARFFYLEFGDYIFKRTGNQEIIVNFDSGFEIEFTLSPQKLVQLKLEKQN